MLSCEAGGVTYGVASAEVDGPARVEPVLVALTSRFEAAVHARDIRTRSFNVEGATPFNGNVSARMDGTRPDASSLQASWTVFAHGTHVFQLSAIGTRLPEDAVAPFEEGSRWVLANPVADPN